MIYAAVQNGVILDTFKTRAEAEERCREEIQRDGLSILFKRKLRKFLKKSGNVALHQYSVLCIEEVVTVK